jgi:SAM-dependent methyltransferase
VQISDWTDWHDEYDDPDSELASRMRGVRARVIAAVEVCPPGPVTLVSICGGQGREVIGALEHHPRRADLRGRLVELDPTNAEIARRSAHDAHLDGFEVVTGDASLSDSYAGLPPVDVVVVSGVLGHLDDHDQLGLVRFLHQLLRPGGRVVWTFFRLRDDPRRDAKLERMRDHFTEQRFDETTMDLLAGDEFGFTVAVSTFEGEREPFRAGERIFSFGSSRRRRDDAPSVS